MTKNPAPHHLAISVCNLETMTRFYNQVLGLPLLKKHFLENGTPRSAWLSCGSMIVMLELNDRVPSNKNNTRSHLLALTMEIKERDWWKTKLIGEGIVISKESPYSIYFNDPEGNPLALSHYPDSLTT